MTNLSSAAVRRAAITVAIVFALPTVVFSLRTYGSFELLRSAHFAGAPRTSSIRAWMTLRYVAGTYHVELPALIHALDLPPDTDPNISLWSAADRAGVPRFQYVERVQRAVAIAANGIEDRVDRSSWLGRLRDQVLSALLVYGYPVLGLSILAGSIGLPLPQGLAATLAGSLIAQDRINWIATAAIVIVASALGDVVAYGCGRLLNSKILQRYGRWFGYSPVRRDRVQLLFDRWGPLAVFVTRTFVSFLSSAASLVAGATHYRFAKFALMAVVGRTVWASAYLGLGYIIGGNLEAATGFLGNLSGLLVCCTALLVALWIGSTPAAKQQLAAQNN